MAWSVNDIYNLVKFLTRKNQAGSISATDLQYNWNAEQSTYFQDLKGRLYAKDNRKVSGLRLDSVTLTRLSPFIKTTGLVIASGSITKPSDYAEKLALTLNSKDIDVITHGQKAGVNASVIDTPSVSENKYYAYEIGNTFKILPSSATGTVTLEYLGSPTDIVWGYTLDGNNRQIYSSGTSTQPQWLQEDIIEITKRSLKGFGVSFKDADFQNFGQIATQTGG